MQFNLQRRASFAMYSLAASFASLSVACHANVYHVGYAAARHFDVVFAMPLDRASAASDALCLGPEFLDSFCHLWSFSF